MSRVTQDCYLALDGDDIGSRLEMHVVTEDADGLKVFASSFNETLDRIFCCVDHYPSMDVLIRGGDSILLKSNKQDISSFLDLVNGIIATTGFTFSGGRGATMRDAYLALKIAKATGKNRIVDLDQMERQ